MKKRQDYRETDIRHKDKKTKRHRDKKTKRQKDKKTKRQKDKKTQRHKDTRTQKAKRKKKKRKKEKKKKEKKKQRQKDSYAEGHREKMIFSTRCYSLDNGKWIVAPNTTKRGYAADVQLKDGKLLVTGGYDSSG